MSHALGFVQKRREDHDHRTVACFFARSPSTALPHHLGWNQLGTIVKNKILGERDDTQNTVENPRVAI